MSADPSSCWFETRSWHGYFSAFVCAILHSVRGLTFAIVWYCTTSKESYRVSIKSLCFWSSSQAVNVFLMSGDWSHRSSAATLLNPRVRKGEETFRNEVVMTCHKVQAWRDVVSWMLLNGTKLTAPQSSANLSHSKSNKKQRSTLRTQ
jgi:hypothetical protein